MTAKCPLQPDWPSILPREPPSINSADSDSLARASAPLITVGLDERAVCTPYRYVYYTNFSHSAPFHSHVSRSGTYVTHKCHFMVVFGLCADSNKQATQVHIRTVLAHAAGVACWTEAKLPELCARGSFCSITNDQPAQSQEPDYIHTQVLEVW